MLSRFNCWFFEKVFSETNMGRTLLMAEIINRDTIIATAHFESLDNPTIRKHQMEEAFNLIKHSGMRNTVIVGDYNFDSTWK